MLLEFKQWVSLIENVGTTRTRPSSQFVANRTQLWGPSAHFGHQDSPYTPIKQMAAAPFVGIGNAIMKRLGKTPTPTAQMPLPWLDAEAEGDYNQLEMVSDIMPLVDPEGNHIPVQLPGMTDEEIAERMERASWDHSDEYSRIANLIKQAANSGPQMHQIKQKFVETMRKSNKEKQYDLMNPKITHELFAEGGVWKVRYTASFRRRKEDIGVSDPRPDRPRTYANPIDKN